MPVLKVVFWARRVRKSVQFWSTSEFCARVVNNTRNCKTCVFQQHRKIHAHVEHDFAHIQYLNKANEDGARGVHLCVPIVREFWKHNTARNAKRGFWAVRHIWNEPENILRRIRCWFRAIGVAPARLRSPKTITNWFCARDVDCCKNVSCRVDEVPIF